MAYTGGMNLQDSLVTSLPGEVVADFARMCNDVAVRDGDMDVVVQPDGVWHQLNV
jgi:FAD/FMN-containing dehydrogenase